MSFYKIGSEVKMAFLLIIVIVGVFYLGSKEPYIPNSMMLVPLTMGVTWVIGLYLLQNHKSSFVISFLISISISSMLFLYIASNVTDSIIQKGFNVLNSNEIIDDYSWQ